MNKYLLIDGNHKKVLPAKLDNTLDKYNSA